MEMAWSHWRKVLSSQPPLQSFPILVSPLQSTRGLCNQRNLWRVGINPFKVPNSFSRTREMISQETATIFSIKRTSETPLISWKRTQVAYINSKKISWLGCNTILIHNFDWPTQVYALNVVSRAIVFDCTSCPVNHFHPK